MRNIIIFFITYIIVNTAIIVADVVLAFMQYSPSLEVGWPYKYYERFQVSGNNIPNHGWYVSHFVYDQILYIFFSFLLLGLVRFIKK
jgi:hypothetical protein